MLTQSSVLPATPLVGRLGRRVRLLVAAAAAVAVSAACAPLAVASPANAFPNQSIVDVAFSHAEGSPGGSCYFFVNRVLAQASGGRVHIGGPHTYFGAYAREGGVQVSAADAQPGDIIQISVPSDDINFYNGMHTAIVVHNLGGGTFDVVDSNWGLDERVHHHVLTPSRAARGNESVQYWRMGQVGTPPAPALPAPGPSATAPAPAPPTAPPAPAASLHVYGLPSGNRLLIRTGPGMQYPAVGSLGNGDPVNIECQTRGGMVMISTIWDEIQPGKFVSDYFVNTPGVGVFTPGLDQCNTPSGHTVRSF